MIWNPPQQAQQMPQQGQPQAQQQWQNPAANWQQTYQNSQWARQAPQYQQMPQQNPYQQMPYQQNPYQRQMPQQMPQFSQQQINQFLSYMQSRPMPNFMADPRYQAQQSQKPVYQPTQQPAMTPRAYVPDVKFYYGGGMVPMNSYTSGDAAADAWVKQRNVVDMGKRGLTTQQQEQKTRDLYKQYYAGAQ